jgi:diketogulonate reductase-like aldo/keto reductase
MTTSSTLSIRTASKLSNGVEIPWLGLGVYQSPPGKITQDAVHSALEEGYRHFDTAALYGNEKDVGQAIRDSGVSRSDVFVTTKLWNHDHGYDSALRAFEASNKRIGLEYIDLYLIHWPVHPQRRDSWRALEKLLADGLCRAIGVSNYTIRHLEEFGDGPFPAVNQVEFSPFLYQRWLLAHCQERQIQLQAYSPLTQGERLNDPTVGELSRKYGRTPAQILIRWALQHRIVVIPKSINPKRIHENAQVFDFDIETDDMLLLDALDEGFRTCWDPSNQP